MRCVVEWPVGIVVQILFRESDEDHMSVKTNIYLELYLDDQYNCNLNNNDETFDSLVVLAFAKWVPQQSIQWIIQKITAPTSRGGSDLQVCLVTDQTKQVFISV